MTASGDRIILKGSQEYLWRIYGSQESLWWQICRERAGPILKDVYFSREYYKLYESETSAAEAFVFIKADNVFYLPYLKNSIADTPYFDFEMAYGYGGPLAVCADDGILREAWGRFYDHCKGSGIIAGFLRFNPFLGNHVLAHPDFVEVIYDRDIVKLTLDKPYETIWEDYSDDNKNKIRKAGRSGIKVRLDRSPKSLENFRRMYHDTMNRVGAEQFYYFRPEYFGTIGALLPEKYAVFTALKDGVEVGGSLVLYTDDILNYHLSATMKECMSLGVANILRDECIKFALANRIKMINFGGGRMSSPDDSLFRFKRSFSKETERFFIGKMIVEEEIYDRACSRWERVSGAGKVEAYKNRVLRYRY